MSSWNADAIVRAQHVLAGRKIIRVEGFKNRDAVTLARAGEVVLNIFAASSVPEGLLKSAPHAFRRAASRGGNWGHFIWSDRSRLIAFGRAIGIHEIHVDRAGTDLQHLDLCGRPLRLAEKICAKSIEEARDR